MILKVTLSQKNNGATMRISRRSGDVISEEMPTFPKMREEIATYVLDDDRIRTPNIAFFHADVTLNAAGGLNVEFDFGRVAPWQPW